MFPACGKAFIVRETLPKKSWFVLQFHGLLGCVWIKMNFYFRSRIFKVGKKPLRSLSGWKETLQPLSTSEFLLKYCFVLVIKSLKLIHSGQGVDWISGFKINFA